MSNVVTIDDSQFASEVLGSSTPVLVYLWASWCGPCRLVSPAMDAIAQTFSGKLKVVKMEVDPNPETVKTYKVEGVPAFRLINNGNVTMSHEGAITKDKLIAMIEQNL
jgi:thioredoxin 1